MEKMDIYHFDSAPMSRSNREGTTKAAARELSMQQN